MRIVTVSMKDFESRSLFEWAQILREDISLYKFGNSYVGRALDSIHMTFLAEERAQKILARNIRYALNYKYLDQKDDKCEKRINEIVRYMTDNMDIFLHRASLEDIDDGVSKIVLKYLPRGCIGFRNGVFDFNSNKWLFEFKMNDKGFYDLDTSEYLMLWYLNYEFHPLDIFSSGLTIGDLKTEELFEIIKDLDCLPANLIWNMSHDENEKPSIQKFEHICDILGYTLSYRHIQKFIILAGDGNNGKNLLFEMMIGRYLKPGYSNINLHTLEKADTKEFLTGSLASYSHNIALENREDSYALTETLKDLTGSVEIEVNKKHESQYKQYFNSKFIFAVNNVEKIKFTDTSAGFKRRINVLSLFYTWDSEGRYLSRGSYKKCDVDGDSFRSEVKDDLVWVYYLAAWSMLKNKDESQYQMPINDYTTVEYSVDGFDVPSLAKGITKTRLRGVLLKNESFIRDILRFEQESIREQRLLAKMYFNFDHKVIDDGDQPLFDEIEDRYKGEGGIERWVAEMISEKVYVAIKVLYDALDPKVREKVTSRKFTSELKDKYVVKTKNNNLNYVRGSFYEDKFYPDSLRIVAAKTKKVNEDV